MSPHDADCEPHRHAFLVGWILTTLLALVPLFVVRYPPSADLPQHLCQLRLFAEHLARHDTTYAINWFWPNTLLYLVIAPACLLPARLAPQGALAVIMALHLAATWALASSRGRPVDAALLATPLLFSHVLYWGLLNFAVGWPAFVVWVLVTTRPPSRDPWRDALALAGAALLLYAAHVLWLFMGIGWLAVHGIVRRIGWRRAAARALALLPALLLVAIWFPQLQAARLAEESTPTWLIAPWDRLRPVNLVEMAFGGLHGPLEVVALGTLTLVLAAALWTNRKRLAEVCDTDLLLAAGLLLASGLLLPDRVMDTIRFATRWVPYGLTLLVLGLPMPARPGRRARLAIAAAAVALFVGATADAWYRYGRDSLGGLDDVLARIPARSRVLGLDVVETSPIVENRPFLQLFAYAQWLHGGELNFSFAEHATGLVRYARPRVTPWTNGLEWFPERVLNTDLRYFDYVIVNGTSQALASLDREPSLAPVTMTRPWRLYRVRD